MGQMGFFDVENRYAALDANNDPLVKINAVVPWEAFRSRLEQVWRKPADKRKSDAGRKPWDAIVMFKAIILCALYNLSDDQVEYQMRDRLSFVRFLGLALEDKVPDAKTVWLYREQLSQAGMIGTLFDDFDGYLKSQGFQAMGGQIIDASIVAVPIQRNRREENEQIKRGETPEAWADKAAKRRQKDTQARWTKKHGKSHYGYKNHVGIDRKHKLIRRYQVTDAAVHDSQVLEELLRTLLHITFPAYKARLDALVLVRARERGLPARQAKPCGQDARAPRKGVAIHKHPLETTICHLGGDEIGKLNRVRILTSDNTASGVWADSAYRSEAIEKKIKKRGLTSRIHRKGYRNRPLQDGEKTGNRRRSRFRARVEHVFGAQRNDMGGTLVRSIGLVRARARIGLKNLAYNMRRLVHLQRPVGVDSR